MHLESGQMDAAKSCFSQALERASLLKENVVAADALVELGLIEAYGKGTPEELLHGIGHLDKARSIYVSVGNNQGRADALFGLGAMYRRLRRCPEAQKALEEAKELYSGLRNEPAVARTAQMLGEVWCDQGQWNLANTPFKEARDIYERLDNKLALANTLYRLGHVHHRRGQYASASGCWTKAQDIYRNTRGNEGCLAETSYWLGILRKGNKQPEQATAYLGVALNYYKSQNDEEWIKKTQDALVEIDPFKKLVFEFEARQRSARDASIYNGNLNRRERPDGEDSGIEPPDELIKDIKYHTNGGFGIVYSGQHKTLGKVALKAVLFGSIKSDHNDEIRV
ncbi:hypothetical protein FRC00_002441 [Tulasnella sp. 408]|nr:hypothetical protein FRC00_002441 [Tulasnella sp. 408]